MEITEYIPFIKEQFQEIENLYGMSWSDDNNEHQMILQNDTTLIRLATFYREEGINIILRNKSKDEFYSLVDLIKLRIKEKEYLTDKDKKVNISYKDNIKVMINVSLIIFKRYCQDMLSGDFSSVGPGNPN